VLSLVPCPLRGTAAPGAARLGGVATWYLCTLVPCSLWYLMPCYPLGVCTPGAAHGGGVV